MRKQRVRALLMGGQACVFYGAAEFSRDVDFAILANAGNLARPPMRIHESRDDLAGWKFPEGVAARSVADAKRSRARQRWGFCASQGVRFQVKGFISFFLKAVFCFFRSASSSAVALKYYSKLGLLSARQFNV